MAVVSDNTSNHGTSEEDTTDNEHNTDGSDEESVGDNSIGFESSDDNARDGDDNASISEEAMRK